MIRFVQRYVFSPITLWSLESLPPPLTHTRSLVRCTRTQFVREQIASPLGLEDSFYLGGLSARRVEPSRIAHVEHTFKVPGRPATGSGRQEEKESAAAAAGQSTRQAAGSSSAGRDRESSRASHPGGARGRESSRVASASAGRDPSAESKQSVANEDEAIGIEDIDEVTTGQGEHPRFERPRAVRGFGVRTGK